MKSKHENQSGVRHSLKRLVRPSRVIVKYTDPFDGSWLATNDYEYNPRLAAAGFYSRSIKIMREGLKSIQADILEGRKPRAKVTLLPNVKRSDAPESHE